MEIKTLRYFLAVAREENMTRAAENLHVTQPTLSKQLKSLEDELGKKLFTRHSFSIELTEEGRNLVTEQGYDPVYGARPLKRAIREDLEDYLAEAILSGKIKPGSNIVITYDSDRGYHYGER